ncbi:disease resistance protein At4g27190-like [Juglans regia]|uniref:Disease resistance protein At4g27190-like n=1 Tax=Juglans regia TaxID=51240 RepID=A0A6P9EYC1_JUGRE|nr:disease resistance protein At4g27190-like [Juglans regia]
MAEYTVAPVGQWLSYSFCYSSNIAKMKNWEEKLQHARDRVQHSIDAAVRNSEEIEADVNKWLTEVNEITELATKVHEGEEEAKMRCSIEVCLSLKLRHQLSRKAKKIVKLVGEALENGKFDRISYRPAPQGIMTTRYMQDCMEFVSRTPIVKGLKEALGDANINVIGLWGMPGVGKTTLIREVAKQVKEDKLIDEVALADVTQSQNLRQIQGEIADMLDLKLDAETIRGRAIRLRERLTKEKRILVILDDIWEKLDLEAIGIDPCKGCKVVLVSRQRDLLSCDMGVQKDFGIEVLPQKEAWELFEMMAADSVKDPNLRSIATEVAKECDGLPIALATVSKALNNKDLSEWKDALQQLRHPAAPEHLTRMQLTIYSCIELSFRHLESQEIQYLFLHCAEKDFHIFHQDLLKYCYGLGLFHGINTLEDARNRLYRQLRNLKDSCLLQDCPHKSKHCHMHDVVRDVATLIASKDYDMHFKKDGGLKEWPDMDALKRCKAISIGGGDIHQLPNELECPELRFLCVNGRDRSLQIPDTFFQGMEKLKVLDLTAMKLSSLPSSLLLLRNLQTLCLDQCELGDIFGIGELKNLVVLSLQHSDISTLPREIGLLIRLRLLDLTLCSKLEVIPPNVLSNLVELEELYMGNSFVQWEAEGLVTERSDNANLAELKYMLRLTTLEIHIRDACMLPKDLRFGKLERYNILVGDVWDWSYNHECLRILKLKLKTSFQSEVEIKMLLNTTECLYLDELKGVKSVLHELDREGFQQLKHLHIQNNDEIKYIIISSPMHISTISFPALEIFHLKNMTGLEDICHGQLHSTSFRNLKVVNVENCEKLKFVFPSSVARGLLQLQQLQIRECSSMGAIVVKESGEIEDTDMIFFPQLRHLALEHLPKLMSFLRTKNSLGTEAGEIVAEGTLDSDMTILHEQVVFPNLEILELSSVDLEETQHNQHRARLSCRLTTMEAMSRFQNLSNLEAMEEVLVTEEIAAAGEITKEVFPRLECLKLTDLPSLTRFCVGCNIQFPSLENMCIDHCPNLVTFVFNRASLGATTNQKIIQTNAEERPPTVMQPLFNVEVALPCLKRLIIRRMDYLKLIWHNQFAENSFCNLQLIDVELCENLVSIFQSDMLTRFQSVEKLFIADCTSLQQVFELQELNVNENQAVIAIPLKGLRLARLPHMKHVWSKDPKAVFSFKNLKEIHASGCENLRSLFPTSVARSLMQLENLEIIDCGVEEIVEGEGEEDAIERFEFPQVTFLTLKRLPRLKCGWKDARKLAFLLMDF